MSRGSKEEIFGERVFRGVSTFFGKVVFKQSPTFPREQIYTPTFTGFGTCTAVNFTWTRVGNRLKVMGKFTAGTTTAVEARISLPLSIVSDAALVPSIMTCGPHFAISNGSGVFPLIESGAGYITMGWEGTANNFTKQNGNLLSAGIIIAMQFEFPASGWN